jgi:hypothetical protein
MSCTLPKITAASLMLKRPEQHQIENQYPIINISIKWQNWMLPVSERSEKRSEEDHYGVAIDGNISTSSTIIK